MITRLHAVGLGLAAFAALGTPDRASAQRVGADIYIDGAGPVSGVIRVGDRPYYTPRPRRVIVEHVYPRRIVVEHRRGWKPWKHRNARVVVVYYDRHSRYYFDRYRRGLEEARVYYDGDRYYRADDRDWDRDRDRYDRDRYDRDRYDRDRDWDRDRDRDRWDDRRDRRDDWARQ